MTPCQWFDPDSHKLLMDMRATAVLAGDTDGARVCDRALAAMTQPRAERDYNEIADWGAASATDALVWLAKEAAFVSYGYPDPSDMAWVANSIDAPLPVKLWLKSPA
jgi:hypothetical protein